MSLSNEIKKKYGPIIQQKWLNENDANTTGTTDPKKIATLGKVLVGEQITKPSSSEPTNSIPVRMKFIRSKRKMP